MLNKIEINATESWIIIALMFCINLLNMLMKETEHFSVKLAVSGSNLTIKMQRLQVKYSCNEENMERKNSHNNSDAWQLGVKI